jgi:hypothetical protein
MARHRLAFLALIAVCLPAGLALAACAGGDPGEETITITTQAAPATTAPPETTAEPTPATTAAPETTVAAPPTSTEAPPATTTPPPTTAETPPASTLVSTAPQEFTLGSDPTATGEQPPATEEEPPATEVEPPQTSEDPVEPTVDRPADFPRKGEARLLDLLYADIANECTRTSPDEVTRGANVSIYCDLRAGDKVQAWYEGFPNVAAMDRAYNRLRRGRGVDPNTRSCQPTQAYPAEAPWYRGEDQSNTLGRLLCFVDSGDVWLVWTDARHRALGWAVNRGGKKKVAWNYWANRGGLT